MTDPGEFMRDLLQALPDALQRLQLLPRRYTGRIVNGADPTSMKVVLDGDDSGTVVNNVYSMIGSLPQDTRVYVDSIPPAGLYVSGFMDPPVPNNLVLNTVVGCTADTPLGAADTSLPGLFVSVDDTQSGTQWVVTSFLDFRETGAGTTIGIGSLYVDGVAVTDDNTGLVRSVLFGMAATTDRGTPGQVWSGTFGVPGAHTFEMQAKRSAAAGTQVVSSTHSTMRVEVYA